MIKAIVFDFGGVLIHWDPKRYYIDYFGDRDQAEWFLSTVCTPEWNLEQDRGRTIREATDLLKERFPEYGREIDAYYGDFMQMIREMPDTVKILYDLKKRFKLYGLTNWSAETFPLALERFGFLRALDGIVVSGEVGLIKPDVAIFQRLLATFDLRPGECVFIDNNRDNVEAAGLLGFMAIQFTTAGALEAELAYIGVEDD